MNSRPTPRAKELRAAFSLGKNLPNFLAALVILFASTQLGLHFWPASALVYGIRVDYLSPTIYFLDLLILTHLIARRSDLKGLEASSPRSSPKRSDLLVSLLPILLVNLLFSANPLATLSWSLHLVLYLLFIFSLPPFVIRHSSFAIIAGMAFQTILGLLQVLGGGSLQGALYYLGERALSVGQPAVASGSLLGRELLRAYGTFSHPNILAGWLVVSLLILIRVVRLQSPKTANSSVVRGPDPLRETWLSAKLFSRTHVRPGQTLLGISLALTSLGVALTQSRTAALALFAFVIPLSLINRWRPRPIYFVVLLCAMSYGLSTNILTQRLDLSLGQRWSLQQLSLQTIARHPLFGTGTQAGITAQSALPPAKRLREVGLQPDHNSFTLFLSWLGPVGAAALLFFLITKLPNYHLRFYDFLPLLPLLLLDHYLLTSPQGLFVLLLYIKSLSVPITMIRSSHDAKKSRF